MDERPLLNIPIDTDSYNRIAALAYKDNRSVSNTAQTMILNELGKLKVDFNKSFSTHEDVINVQEEYIISLLGWIANYEATLSTQPWFKLSPDAVESRKIFERRIKILKSSLVNSK